MRKPLRIIVIIVFIIFLYCAIGGIFLLNKTKEASERLLGSVMLMGSNIEKTYSPEVTLFPPESMIKNLNVKADEGYLDGYKWYDIQLKCKSIIFSPSSVMKGEFPRIKRINGFTFAGKTTFDVLGKMLEEKNKGWSEIKVGRLGDSGSNIYIYAKNQDADQSVNLIGTFIVNKDGFILFYPADNKYFDEQGNLDIKAFNEARKGMELNWHFRFFGGYFPANRVAVSEAGIYLEAGDIVEGGISDPNKQPETTDEVEV